jgi:hypothetical protein
VNVGNIRFVLDNQPLQIPLGCTVVYVSESTNDRIYFVVGLDKIFGLASIDIAST